MAIPTFVQAPSICSPCTDQTPYALVAPVNQIVIRYSPPLTPPPICSVLQASNHIPGEEAMTQQNDAIYFHGANDKPYGPFSNFARYGVFFDDHYWPTVEHYFQSQKFVGTPHFYDVLHAPTPEEAKRIGQDRARPLRPDWEQARVDVMRKVVVEKFLRYPELQKLLAQTADRPIIKRSRSDLFWGQRHDGAGRNLLGEILMDVREHLRHAPGPTDTHRPTHSSNPLGAYEASDLEQHIHATCALRVNGHGYLETRRFDDYARWIQNLHQTKKCRKD